MPKSPYFHKYYLITYHKDFMAGFTFNSSTNNNHNYQTGPKKLLNSTQIHIFIKNRLSKNTVPTNCLSVSEAKSYSHEFVRGTAIYMTL